MACKQRKDKTLNVVVTGLPGAGKSYLLSQYDLDLISRSQKDKYVIIKEPIELFSNFNCKSKQTMKPLEIMYSGSDPSGPILTQLHILDTYKQVLQEMKMQDDIIRLWDHSLDDSHVFTNTLYTQKKISDFGYQYALKRYTNLKEKYAKFDMDAVLFLDVGIDVCLERQVKRNRTMEVNYSGMRSYMETLQEEYYRYIDTMKETIGEDAICVCTHTDVNDCMEKLSHFIGRLL